MTSMKPKRIILVICLAAFIILVISSLQLQLGWSSKRRAIQDNFTDRCDDRLRDIYLNTVKKSVSGVLLRTPTVLPSFKEELSQLVQTEYNDSLRLNGWDWPLYGQTMVGLKRLNNIQSLLQNVIHNGIHGDFVECGVWRGGSSIFARATLYAMGDNTRKVHLVDSFKGLPVSTSDKDHDEWSITSFLAVSKAEVMRNFEVYGLLDDHVVFHEGYFRYVLPSVAKEKLDIAVLRMDGDMYESTMDIFYNLWDRVQLGGYIIIDDYGIPECRNAVSDFTQHLGISPDFIPVDHTGVYFEKREEGKMNMSWYIEFNATRSLRDQTPKKTKGGILDHVVMYS